MSFTEYILSAFRCLSASKMRTFLTTLGIIVGISSVILINTIGNTIGKTIGSTLNAQMQGNIMQVLIVEKDADTSSLTAAMTFIPDGEMKFRRSWIEKYEEFMGDTLGEYLDFSIGKGKLTTSENTKASINFQASSALQLRSYGYTLEKGRYLSDMDDDTGSASVVISSKSAEKMFGKNDPIGKQVVIGGTGSVFDGRELTVVGVYKYNDQLDRMLGNDTDSDDFSTTAFVSPAYYYNAVNKGSDSSDQIYLMYLLDSDADVEQITKDTEEFFEPYFEDTDYRIWVYTATEELDQINEIINVITKIISAIAAISLLVGGIGVMNIMLVSVTERTMEIGVRKAMGADNNSIRIQFLVESVIISIIGSVLGIVIGLVLAKTIALIISAASSDIVVDLSAPVSAIIMSVVFSFAVGLVFGVYPADKAAKMEVVDALRYE